MKKKATCKSSVSPLAEKLFCPPLAKDSPKSTVINKKKRTLAYASTSASAFFKLKSSPLVDNNRSDNHKSPATISDLKDFASSRVDDIKRNLIDRSHSEIVKDFEASYSRLHKRFKIQTQMCQQLMDEVEKEHKKMSEWTSETQEATMASYKELQEDVEATASRCKTTLEELSKSFDKGINDLRSCFGIPAP
ncbi:uncharacterized protein LOC110806367 isoform X2 [Carica papaya]|uniref:uncharacterized protein LOC110806367 isoform X2 n=1 Tax=Carica papaya TaxID=3649 RepID=UPI000B8CC911|nr:uncharacterized protein LOC110806367 isoform X2 [Carica papaya]